MTDQAKFLQPVLSSGVELVKMGGVVYILGLVVSVTYYARYRVLSIDLLHAQSVLVGVYVLAAYLFLPYACALVARRVKGAAGQVAVFLAAMVGLYTVLLGWLGLPALDVATGALLGTLLVASGSLRFAEQAPWFGLSPTPRHSRLAVMLLLAGVHLGHFGYGAIPSFLGGGKPVTVDVYAEGANLLQSRYVRSRNKAAGNNLLVAYKMPLLYESSDQLYFLEERKSAQGTEGFVVIRVPKDKVVRIDFKTNRWVAMRR